MGSPDTVAAMTTSPSELKAAPGTEHAHDPGTRRRRRWSYELLSCGINGHELVGTDAEELRPEDSIFVRDAGAEHRWYRCLRCDSWVMLPAPATPSRKHPPAREDIPIPLRGRPLRDKFVLRLIAIDRAIHFVVLGAIAIVIFLFLSHRAQLRGDYYRIMNALHGALGGPTTASHSTILVDLRKLFSLRAGSLQLLGVVVLGYAVLEGVEAVGLWYRRRWAEYLTFIATTLLFVPEIYELTKRFTVLKVIALVVNLLVVAYLLYAKRLFGFRGGGAADRAALERDSGWQALESRLPPYHELSLPHRE